MESDVVVENFKPGVAARLGVGHEQLRAAKPALVYASISGYGQGHPEMAGYDQIAQGTSGLMSLTGPPAGPPTKVGIPIGDVAAGMFAAQAIMAALLARARTGAGAHIDIALNDSLIAMLAYQAGRFFALGSPPRAEGNFHSTIAPYGTFQAADGSMNIAVASDEQYARFCSALGAPELTDDERFRTNADRQQHRDELTAEVEARLRRRTRQEWLAELVKAGIPAGPILDVAEAFGSPLAGGMRVDVQHPVAGLVGQVAPPIRFDGCRPPIRRPPPRLGEHTDEVLEELLRYSRQQSQAASA
jgi:crotonobetainyl-CoA:carnitine CoA-transferase CaiB-like acyl-CoA transferase